MKHTLQWVNIMINYIIRPFPNIHTKDSFIGKTEREWGAGESTKYEQFWK